MDVVEMSSRRFIKMRLFHVNDDFYTKDYITSLLENSYACLKNEL